MSKNFGPTTGLSQCFEFLSVVWHRYAYRKA